MVGRTVEDPKIDPAVSLVAGHIRHLAEAVLEAHEFGHGPGPENRPWTLSFQRRALAVYRATISWDYLAGLAASFTDAFDRMGLTPPQADPIAWACMRDYLASTTSAIGAASPSLDVDKRADEIAPRPPIIVHFAELAALISSRGARDLHRASAHIENLAEAHQPIPLSAIEMEWLRLMLRGDRVVDIAQTTGYSERQLYRSLSRLWSRLGVSNRHEAIALAIDQGWLRIT